VGAVSKVVTFLKDIKSSGGFTSEAAREAGQRALNRAAMFLKGTARAKLLGMLAQLDKKKALAEDEKEDEEEGGVRAGNGSGNGDDGAAAKKAESERVRIETLLRLHAYLMLGIEAASGCETDDASMTLNAATQILGSAALVRSWLSQSDVPTD